MPQTLVAVTSINHLTVLLRIAFASFSPITEEKYSGYILYDVIFNLSIFLKHL